MNNYQNRVGFFPKTALNLQSCDGEQKIKSHLAMIHLWAGLCSARLEFYCCCEFTAGGSTCGTDKRQKFRDLLSLGQWDNPVDNPFAKILCRAAFAVHDHCCLFPPPLR